MNNEIEIVKTIYINRKAINIIFSLLFGIRNTVVILLEVINPFFVYTLIVIVCLKQAIIFKIKYHVRNRIGLNLSFLTVQ